MGISDRATIPGPVGGLGAYQKQLSVSLIATPREEFVTCSPEETLGKAREMAQKDGFDFVPVESEKVIVGVLDIQATSVHPAEDPVASHHELLAEKYLVGADSSILDFVEQADEQPFRLLVTSQGISGLVSISDIQQLASRSALFALVTLLELTMARVIRDRCPSGEWTERLSEARLQKAKTLWNEDRKSSRQVDLLTYTQFCDKAEVLCRLVPTKELGSSGMEFRESFKKFQRLRDALAHANHIEASPETCGTVRAIRIWIEKLEAMHT